MNQNDCSGKTLKLWPVFVDHYISTDNSIPIDEQFITDRGDLITDNAPDIGSELERDASGRFITSRLPYPYVDNLDCLSPIFRQQLEEASALARKKKRLSNEVMDEMILTLCKGHYMPLSVISKLMDRTPQNLREKQLVPLVKAGKIRLAFPHARRHKRQGYISGNVN